MKYLPLILLVATAQAQTLYTCGTKQADPKHCLAAKLCVTSNTTHKAYCGATMAAAEAQEMAHEPEALAPKKTPLKCGKYQHVSHWPGPCGPAWCDSKSMTCDAICTPVPPDTCVDDTHVVTEKEWQSILKRLSSIEAERLPRPAIADSKGGLVIHYKASDIKPGEACPSGMHWAQGNSYFDSLPHDKNGNVIAGTFAGTYWGNGDDPATADYYFCERNK